ncbi:LysM peptidoglycan-binding domain-containing protein [Candidatus Leptofilum sp.]|uniref:LysM peptidoglycan-binding domain-containing protein n=1 Tax=Candidatus Leptofilum sp. TaxID=3241576 RepID=UPI003B5A7C60
MVSQRRLLSLITLFILLTLITVACERPLGGTDDPGDGDSAGEVTDVNQGGGTDGNTATTDDSAGSTEDATTEDATTEDPATEEGNSEDSTDSPSEDTAEDPAAEDNGGAGDDAANEEETGDAAEDDAAEDSADEENTEQEGNNDEEASDTGDGNEADDAQDDSDETTPATHTVAAGENLYRIGLKYGISWVAIANENNLANPNVLTVGQVLKLPGASQPDPGPTPTPSPQTETTYIVQPGDNLFRIGLKFGISWVQIAEANGLVNPNLIKVGDELKIPVDAPGPAPAFSHVVKQGETLFLISLQYGVAWPAIAEANDLTSPYIIYVGQTLEIPGSQ